MDYTNAKQQFIIHWGALATQWGINKTMAQIHALLMVSEEPLCVEDLMTELKISRGNVSMNLRELINWGIVYKHFIPGERKEYFITEEDINEMARKIAIERSRREIKPILQVLDELKQVDDDNSKEAKYFQSKMNQLNEVIILSDNVIEKLTSQKGNWVTKSILKLLK